METKPTPIAITDVKKGDRIRVVGFGPDGHTDAVVADVTDNKDGTWTITPEVD